jgi:hypothetical protein
MQAAAAEQLASQPVMGPDGTPLPVGAVGVNAEGLPVNANWRGCRCLRMKLRLLKARVLKRFERN